MTYVYTKETYDLARLTQEINLSIITIALDHINATGNELSIIFKAEISNDEKTILDGIVAVHDGTPLPDTYIQNIKGEVTPTSPKNEFTLRPFGVVHKHINAAGQLFTITLSNKSDKTYTYSCTQDPRPFDCIWADHGQIRDGVESVDVENHTVTMFYGLLGNEEATLTKYIDIDYQIPEGEDYQVVYLWGSFIDIKDYGDDDLIRLQVVDIAGIGVALGWYTQEEFDYMGEYIVREYDECWARQLDEAIKIMTPDGAPGELPAGLYLRARIYCKDATKTDIKYWLDYIITTRDAV